ncbi:phosphate-selective porin OprO/OprP [Methylohalomonas lacus]|uniref:Phosphate-selective porin OprO/OprP n=1 Tax=Methylohalomonas lacus TaxID=398773 RepID=A0AAE3HIN9_9GAMM|nr:OprO/OprP family phosphate-selective porin [Methylohalomonas lacus]MCS3903066.1 phosphate-selective porin OprO/OprP [Methylohalomonas lacus]
MIRDGVTVVTILIPTIMVSPPVAATTDRPSQSEPSCQTVFCLTDTRNDLRLEGNLRLQLDAAAYRDDGAARLDGGTNVRRARFSARAQLGDAWTAKFTYDVSKDGVSGIRDAFVSYTHPKGRLERLRIKAGHFKEPFGMERLTSVRDLAFMERSLASTLTPNRNMGIELHRHDRQWTATAGVFVPGTSDDNDNIRHSASARATLAPDHSDGRILHFGAAIAYRSLDSSRSTRFSQQPESRVTDLKLVDTGAFAARDYVFYGLETAWAQGPWSLQADYIHAHINRPDSFADVGFQGWHIDAGWILTGEAQPYNSTKGTFGRLRPAPGAPGIWQLGLRLSELDLNDAGINGGRQRNASLGLTWYSNHYLTLSTEYVQVLNIDGGAFDGARPSALQARVQLIY